ncbi:collagen-like protein [Ectopseudomonas khazarica]|uniref:collagen-like protein n=1 Tax=Ectopseudomonas khazarica TaxID=2502979 RepID=UPI00106E338F|nr:collagen-like protein [Pseudomonas khazarica]
MRKLALLLCLCTGVALADNQVKVPANALMRLPVASAALQLDRLEVADHATLMIPAKVTELRIGTLLMGREARIGVAPSDQPLRLEVQDADVGAGAWISAKGAAGTYSKAATPGREIKLKLHKLTFESLTLDVRGGRGAPGYAGLDGAHGKPGGCTWGQASAGYDGQDGTDGHAGAAGGNVVLEVPHYVEVERLQVLLDGGEGGVAGAAGRPGHGGAAKDCLLYGVDGAADGNPGQPGRAGAAGRSGAVQVFRF